MQWKQHRLDGAIQRFQRSTGLNVRYSGPETADITRVAPRVLQIGLLTPCNLSCSFCYRDTAAPSRLDAPFLLDLLRQADEWGVCEVAFGGGEPLLFPGFTDLVGDLYRTTGLGLGFTTNGTLLTDDIAAELSELVGEIRLSAYETNDYRTTLKRFAGVLPIGLNWMVTPATVGLVEATVRDALALGATNVLLLGYKGPDPSLHLGDADLARLAEAVRRCAGMPVKLDVCWYPKLKDVESLFERHDCEAGDDFLVITPDRAVQSCSFHESRFEFETFDELVEIYRRLRAEKPAAAARGCTRPEFNQRPAPTPSKLTAWAWNAFSSNNSGDHTIVASFSTPEEAEQAAASVREMARAHSDFITSDEGEAFIEANEYNGSIPTPPMIRFGEAHGIDWSKEGDGLWWEEDSCGGVLTVGALGSAVIVFHIYCMGLPDARFKEFFQRVGATAFHGEMYGTAWVVVSASGRNEAAETELAEYLRKVRGSEWPGEAGAPPWGEKVAHPMLVEDEDDSGGLAELENELELLPDGIRLRTAFTNSYAGALGIERWLTAEGYRDVAVAFEELPAVEGPPADRVAPQVGLFGDVRPLGERFADATDAELAAFLIEKGTLYTPLEPRFASADAAVMARELLRAADAHLAAGNKLPDRLPELVERLGAPAAALARFTWEAFAAQPFHGGQQRWLAFMQMKMLHVCLPKDEAWDRGSGWALESLQSGDRAEFLTHLRDDRVVAVIEKYWQGMPPDAPVHANWRTAIAVSGLGWPVLNRWLRRGRPWNILALETLLRFSNDGAPEGFQKPTADEFEAALSASENLDDAPRQATIVSTLREGAERLTARG